MRVQELLKLYCLSVSVFVGILSTSQSHFTASLSQYYLDNTCLTCTTLVCVCRAPLSEKDLVDDVELKAKIDMWKQQRSST